jgi:hypothetical protein
MDLAILHEALKLVEAHELLDAFALQRQSGYLRRAAFLWEKANASELALPWPSTGGNYIGFVLRRDMTAGRTTSKPFAHAAPACWWSPGPSTRSAAAQQP